MIAWACGAGDESCSDGRRKSLGKLEARSGSEARRRELLEEETWRVASCELATRLRAEERLKGDLSEPTTPLNQVTNQLGDL